MDTKNLSKVVKGVRLATVKHSPEILTGIGIAGMITTTIMAVKATPKALDLLAEVKDDHAEDTDKKAYGKDILTKVAPVYIPSLIIGGLSTSCLIWASSVNYKRNAALATAYALSESALKEYQEKVVETIGRKKEEEVRAAVVKDRVDRDHSENREVFITGSGETLCYDPLSDRFFSCNPEKIKRVENRLNREMRYEMYVTLNEFYDEIGLHHTDLGESFGWTIDNGYIDIEFVANKTPDDKPYLALQYDVKPDYLLRR